jgi:hypothetical protein
MEDSLVVLAALRATSHRLVGLSGEFIQAHFQFKTFGFQLRGIRLRRDPQGWSP